MTPVLCNSSPISQKGGVAVLCPVALLGTFPYLSFTYLFASTSEKVTCSLCNKLYVVFIMTEYHMHCVSRKSTFNSRSQNFEKCVIWGKAPRGL